MNGNTESQSSNSNATFFHCRNSGYRNVSVLRLSIVFVFSMKIMQAIAADADFPVMELSIAQQNEMMHKYCVICHLDSAMNGGLSLEHFDAFTVPPALAAMLVNKFTYGVPLEEILRPELDPLFLSLIEEGKKMGAPSVMNIAGLPLPSEEEINGFIMSMAARAQDSEQWYVVRDGDQITADVVRVTPVPLREGRRDLTYRLTLTCDSGSNEGEMLLSWSPAPVNGELEAIVDGGMPLDFVLDHQEPMANGDPGTSAPSSVVLAGAARMEKHTELPMPESSLQFSGLFPVEPIEFTFSELREADRRRLKVCFE